MRSHHLGTGFWKNVVVVSLSVASSIAVASFFNLHNKGQFLLFVIGVIISSWYGGLVPGLAATVFSFLAADYLLVEPVGSLWPHDTTDFALLLLLLLIGVAISLLQHSLRKTNAALEKANSALTEANLALQNSTERLSQSNAELERFSFTLAHDLLEPLRSIHAMTELFLHRHQATLDHDSAQMLDYVLQGAERMKTLIQDILEFAKVKDSPETDQIDAQAVAESAVRYLQEAVNQSGAKITIDSLPVVQANEGHLFRLFLNLIGNAIKYRSERTPEIQISARPHGENWVFSVSDNGIGIDPQYQAQVFDLFRRLHPTSKYEGSGVGLAICKRIVEGHHGQIWVESQPGFGSTFWFTIPKVGMEPSEAKHRPNQGSEVNVGRDRAAG